MTEIEIKIASDLKQAMLQKDTSKLRTLRAVKAAFTQAKTEKGADKELSEDKALKILQKLLKQRQESKEIFDQQNRTDLAQKESEEIDIIKNYLPETLSAEETEKIVIEIVKETGAESMKDMGKVMKIAGEKLSGRADTKILADIVKKLLS
ncbi:MAG: GatB/YqeY domain-containing protein [Chitinophagaceae bacterium]|nr:MAG: GatB/YqeY domain-containing protein [Chitinophagaceae bacterium]